MTIRNMTNITNVALALAAFALAAPAAQSQTRVYNSVTGRYTSNRTSGMYNRVNANNIYSGNTYAGYLYGSSPYMLGGRPYIYNNDVYAPGGALVMGADGQLYNPFLDNGAVEPTVNADGVTIPVPVAQNPALQNPMQLSDQIEAVRLPGNRVRIVWSGDPRPIASMRFSLLDSKRVVLKSVVVTDLPAEAIFTRPSNAAYYRVMITYGDGAVRSIVAPF